MTPQKEQTQRRRNETLPDFQRERPFAPCDPNAERKKQQGKKGPIHPRSCLIGRQKVVDVHPLKEADMVEANPKLRESVLRNQEQLRIDVSICTMN